MLSKSNTIWPFENWVHNGLLDVFTTSQAIVTILAWSQWFAVCAVQTFVTGTIIFERYS